MKLSEVAFDNLHVGDALISARGVPGVITKLIPREKATRNEDAEIVIQWDNGNISWNWHFWMDQIEYLGQK